MPLKAKMAKNQKKTNILAYAVKSDNSRKTEEKPISCLCCKKRLWRK
jgi:hypothetical protein